jgi:hypothetical protein
VVSLGYTVRHCLKKKQNPNQLENALDPFPRMPVKYKVIENPLAFLMTFHDSISIRMYNHLK